MAGSSNQFTYGLGVTQLAVPTGTTGVMVIPPAYCNGVELGWYSGGSLSITNQWSQGASAGWVLGTTERKLYDGPVKFFLNATGATSVAQIIFKMSSGYSGLGAP